MVWDMQYVIFNRFRNKSRDIYVTPSKPKHRSVSFETVYKSNYIQLHTLLKRTYGTKLEKKTFFTFEQNDFVISVFDILMNENWMAAAAISYKYQKVNTDFFLHSFGFHVEWIDNFHLISIMRNTFSVYNNVCFLIKWFMNRKNM